MLLQANRLILRSAARARLEGWPQVRALRPSFETLASQAPQDEGARRSVTRAQHLTSSARWLRRPRLAAGKMVGTFPPPIGTRTDPGRFFGPFSSTLPVS